LNVGRKTEAALFVYAVLFSRIGFQQGKFCALWPLALKRMDTRSRQLKICITWTDNNLLLALLVKDFS
jgi:hypothetical protein